MDRINKKFDLSGHGYNSKQKRIRGSGRNYLRSTFPYNFQFFSKVAGAYYCHHLFLTCRTNDKDKQKTDKHCNHSQCYQRGRRPQYSIHDSKNPPGTPHAGEG